MAITSNCAEIIITNPQGSVAFNKLITTTELSPAKTVDSEDRVYLIQNSENAPQTFWWNLEKAIADGFADLEELYDYFVAEIASQCGGGIESIVAGTNITVDDTDPLNPIVSAIGGSSAFLSKTKAEMDALILGNNLVAGALYEITGVHPTLYNDGTTSGTTVYLNAISGSELEVQGMGKFYNPKYNQAVDGFGIWDNKMYGTFSTIVGNFDYQNKETVTADNSATGILLADGMIQFVSGNWGSATSITGDTSSATADVAGFVTPSYSIGDKVIWGGYSWTNVNGLVGSSTDVLNLDAEWSKDTYDTTNYNIAYDLIEYAYANDMIIRRFEKESNVDVKCSKAQYDFFVDNNGLTYHSISVQQFGNPFDYNIRKGILNKYLDNAYDESINFSGSRQVNLTFGESSYQQNLTFGQESNQNNLTFGQSSYQKNLTFGQGASQNNLTFGQNSYQQNLIFGQNSYQYNITFGEESGQYNLTFGTSSYQENLTFGTSSSQSNLTFGQNSNQQNLTFGTSSSQSNLTFGEESSQSNLTFGQDSYQENLTFGQNSRQENLTFGQNSQVNFNNQTLNSSIKHVEFKTKDFTVPDLSSATYIFDSNIKEVYKRPDGTIKLKFMNNSDVLEVHGIAD